MSRIKKNIRNLSPCLYKILKLINKNVFFPSKNFLNHITLKYIFGIKKVGRHVTFSKGFNIFNGSSNIEIGNNVFLTDVLLNAGDYDGSIKIEDFVFFSHKVMVIARGHDYNKVLRQRQTSVIEAPIVIKSGAWIGSGAIILKGVTIGTNSVIAAGSVVIRDVMDNSIVAGNPAKLIKSINIVE